MKLIIIILYLIFYLPFFFEYTNLLPSVFKSAIELLIVLYFIFLFLNGRIKNYMKSNIYKLYLIFNLLIIIVYIISTIINNSDFIYLFIRCKTFIISFLLFNIFLTYIHKSNNIVRIRFFFKQFSKIQIYVSFAQYLLAFFFSFYLKEFQSFDIIDIAAGTIGRGTGLFAVLCVMIFIYYFTFENDKKAFIYLLPLLVTFSSGANMILVIAIILSILLNASKVKLFSKTTMVYIIIIVIAGVFVSTYIIKDNIISNSINYISKTNSNVNERNIIIYDNGKLTRQLGYLYIIDKLDKTDNEIFGIGPDALVISKAQEKINKVDGIEEILNTTYYLWLEIGYVGIVIYYLFLIILSIMLFKGRKNKFFKGGFIIVIIFILSSYYTTIHFSLPIMVFFSFILAILIISEQKIKTNKYGKISQYNNTNLQKT